MTSQQERRERIAAQVLAGMMADPSVDGHPNEFAVSAIEFADALIAELDRTAPPSNQPESPEGWVVWADYSDCRYPIRDSRGQWFYRVHPWDDRAEAQAVADDLGCRVRKWPLDPSEDTPEVKPEGWVIWDDREGEDGRPIRDRQFWVAIHGYDIAPFATKKEAEDELSSWRTDRNCRVRRWPLDPSEDKEVQP